MSAESVQAYVNWVKQSDGINSQAARQLNSITSQLNALNPGNPNSTAQLAALQKQAQAVVNSRDSQIAALGRPPNPANLTERELAQVGALIGLNAGNGLIDYRGALDSLQSAGAAAQQNIKTTQSAGTSRGQTVPVTTGDGTSKPVTNVAASANTTTRTSVTETATSVTTRTGGVDIVVDKKPVVTETSTSVTTRTGGFDIVVDKPRTRPDPIAVTADVDPITGRAEPIAVTNGDPSLTITDEPLATPVLDEARLAALAAEGQASVEAALLEAQGEATAQDQANFAAKEDWRVRLSLAPDSEYLYNAKPDPGILKPLLETDGVIFPYTPSISVNYAANYEQTNIVHSNYKIFQYSGSGVDAVSLSCNFTAQDTYEANYLLAVIHFFRSMTKMFYGQDDNPKNGTPPPLCYMFGMGGYQFAAHPLAIQGFSYTLPDDVDYIKTTSASPAGTPKPSKYTASDTRLAGSGVGKGGKGPGPNFSTSPGNDTVTWVPTRIQMSITCVPIMSRNSISNRFSLRDYASGKLLNGTREPGGGMW
jgi:hypothetical protein